MSALALIARPAFSSAARTALTLARYASTSADAAPPPPPTRATHYATDSLKKSMGPGISKSAAEEWARRSDYAMSKLCEPPTAYSGRTVEVRNSLATAYNTLRSVISKNNIIAELRQQQRHEKKGYKRRRLRSERWRRLFASQVREKVRLVQSIVRRGA